MADGNDCLVQMKEKGEPVEIVYPTEGTPIIVGPSGVMKNAPNPNAARLLANWMFSLEAQQLMVDFGGLKSAHALVKEKEGRKPLKEIKTMKDDRAAVEAQAEDIKAKYARYFVV
jgi:iron(III) transport system substrate-binding protein